MLGATFNLVTRAAIFGTLKDDSLKINSLASNNCFSHRNVFQNGVNTLSKIVNHFLSKSTNFFMVLTIRFCSNFTSMWSKYVSNNVWRDFTLDFQCQHWVSISNGNIKCPIGKSIFAVNLPLKLFRATVANADIKSLMSLHAFLQKCLHQMLVKFEQNRMVQTTRNFEVFDKKRDF